MESKETKLKIYAFTEMIDFDKMSKEEPELFDELCKDYPLEDGVYMFVKKSDKK